MSRRYIFIDESGDFGFSPKSSRYITLCAIIVSDKVVLERIPRRTRRQLNATVRMKPELKFHGSDEIVKRKVLGMFALLPEAHIASISLDKARIEKRYQKYKGEIYDRMCGALIGDILQTLPPVNRIEFNFDIRPMNKPKSLDFDDMILRKILTHSQRLRIISPFATVSRMSSERNKGLIVADFIAGAIRRKYERRSPEYYDIISNLIISERMWSP